MFKVKYTGKGGYQCEKDSADRLLTVDEWYDVEYVDVGGWCTYLRLFGFDNQTFNSALFEESEGVNIAISKAMRGLLGYDK